MKLRVSEIYLSVQGEGPYAGTPTVFVRFAGCNLRCPGWPCDTPHAIFPEQYRKEWKHLSPREVHAEITKVAGPRWDFRVCYTGGEPFLQPKEALEELTDSLWGDPNPAGIDCFSNGTLPYPKWALEGISFVMDWKLPGSGEVLGEQADNCRMVNLYNLKDKDALKFTIKDEVDFEEAVELWEDNAKYLQRRQVFYGPVWGAMDPATLVDWVLEGQLPWRLTMQTHNIIWPPNERAR